MFLGVATLQPKGQLIQQENAEASFLLRTKSWTKPTLTFSRSALRQDDIIGYLRVLLDED